LEVRIESIIGTEYNPPEQNVEDVIVHQSTGLLLVVVIAAAKQCRQLRHSSYRGKNKGKESAEI